MKIVEEVKEQIKSGKIVVVNNNDAGNFIK